MTGRGSQIAAYLTTRLPPMTEQWSVADLAGRAGLKLESTANAVRLLRTHGRVELAGYRYTGSRGRPISLYRAVAEVAP